MPDIAIGGVALIILVPLLVQAAKMLGMDSKFAPWLALVLSLLGAIMAEIVVKYPNIEPWVTAVIGGLMVFLGSTGIYTLSKNLVGTMKKGAEKENEH